MAYCKRGKGLIKVNGRPLELVQPEALSFKLQEPILLLGKDRSGLLNTVHSLVVQTLEFTGWKLLSLSRAAVAAG